jgi:hypothetical protein
MQTANITLLLGGDAGNTVQKFGITPSEIAVLRFIHGEDAVVDVSPVGDVKRSSREERQRLAEIYGRSQPNGQFSAPAIDSMFPGIAARMFETLDELGLDESFFKAETRVSTKSEDAPAKPAKKGKKAVEEPVAETPVEIPAEGAEDDEGEDDGIGEIKDNLFK